MSAFIWGEIIVSSLKSIDHERAVLLKRVSYVFGAVGMAVFVGTLL